MGGECRLWQPRPWGCPWGYLEGEPLDVHHLPKPAQGSVDELQHRQEGNEVGRNVGHEPHGGGSPVACSFQDVLLFPAWKKDPDGLTWPCIPCAGSALAPWVSAPHRLSQPQATRHVHQIAPVVSPHQQDTCSPTLPSLSPHSPTGEADASFALEFGLFHFGVDEFGHGKGAGRSHHGGRDQ